MHTANFSQSQSSLLPKKCTYVRVYLKEARHLPTSQEERTPHNLYCTVQIGRDGAVIGETAPCKAATHHTWVPVCDITLNYEQNIFVSTHMYVRLYHENQHSNTCIGFCRVALPKFTNGIKYEEKWTPIKDSHNNNMGEMLIGWHFSIDEYEIKLCLPETFVDSTHDQPIISRILEENRNRVAYIAVESEGIESLSTSNTMESEDQERLYFTQMAHLNNRLSRLKLQQILMTDDGNCQFRAIAHQLWGTEEYHMILRERCCVYLTENSDLFSCYYASEGEFATYVQRMRYSGAWGDELTLKAVCNLLCAEIHVISSEFSNWYLKYTPDTNHSKETKKVFIAYLSPFHYNSLADLPDIDTGSFEFSGSESDLGLYLN